MKFETLSTLPAEVRDEFLEFHRAHPEVWRLFERFALDAARSGRRIGAKAIAERIRWETVIEQRGEFKLNNNHTAIYARIFAEKYPAMGDVFEFRTMRRAA